MTFFVVNKKFEMDAHKAFFNELSTRLEYMSEDLSQETPDSHFEEMAEILTELRAQAQAARAEKILQANKIPVKIEFMSNNEVAF